MIALLLIYLLLLIFKFAIIGEKQQLDIASFWKVNSENKNET